MPPRWPSIPPITPKKPTIEAPTSTKSPGDTSSTGLGGLLKKNKRALVAGGALAAGGLAIGLDNVGKEANGGGSGGGDSGNIFTRQIDTIRSAIASSTPTWVKSVVLVVSILGAMYILYWLSTLYNLIPKFSRSKKNKA